MSSSHSFAIRILSRLRMYPHRFFLLRIGPQKLLEYDEMMAAADLQSDNSVLDIGCGTGVQTLLLGKKCRQVVGVDISDEAISLARGRAASSMMLDIVDFVRADAAHLSFEKGSFDRILSFCVLEHIPNWREVLSNTCEWLSPNGYLVISVDSLATLNDAEVIKKHRQDFSVISYFDCDALESALQGAGYTDIELKPILRSEHAKQWFTEAVLAGATERRNIIGSFGEYLRLRGSDKKASEVKQGIFIIAKAKAK